MPDLAVTESMLAMRERIVELERDNSDARERATGLERLLDACATIARARSPHAAIEVTLRAARGAIGFARAYYISVDRRREVEAVLVVDGADVVERCSERPEAGPGSALLAVLRGERTLEWGSSTDLSAPFPDVRGWYAVAALRRGAVTHGAIYLDGHTSEAPRRQETRAVRALAAIAAIAIENAATFERTKALAARDELTGLLNRRAFSRRLARELERSQTGRSSFAYVVIDVDDFKGINDTRGHGFGDTVLVRIARALSRASRSQDVVARLAGDEFVVLLSGADRAAAGVLVARLAQSLADDGLRCSLGASVYPDDAHEAESLFAAADRALYATKAAGKNGYSFADGTFGSAPTRVMS